MPNYIINQCLTNEQFVISADTALTVGVVYRFGFGESELICGTVEAVTEEPITPSYYYDFAEYTDCCECLADDGRGTLNFNFIICGTEQEINIEAANFCSQIGLPITGLTYEIQLDSYVPFCATFQGLSESGETNYFYVSGPSSGCEDCGEEPPRSANTETFLCQEICTSGGTTTISVTPPHPVWTDGYGTEVTQLNMITLGGINGLNN